MGVIAALHSIPQDKFQVMASVKSDTFDEYTSKMAYIDKSWAIITYILVGEIGHSETNVLSEIINPISNYISLEDEWTTWYVSYSLPEKVKTIHQELKRINETAFKTLFENCDLDKINPYPEFWNKSAEQYEYIYHHFKSIQDIFEYAAQNEEYIVTDIG